MKIRILDIAAIALSLAAIAAFSVAAYAPGGGKPEVVISSGGSQWIYPLDREAEIPVPGPLGDTVVHIHGGAVRVESSPCKNQICVASGAISRPGQMIACLPNKVMVRIRGGTDAGGVDAQTW